MSPSRRRTLRALATEFRHSSDKAGMAVRAARKFGRAAQRIVRRPAPPAAAPTAPAAAPLPEVSVDFNELLHLQRSLQLGRLSKGTRTFVSAGCSGRWYFDWIEEWCGPIERHIGIEAFSPEPADLPANVEWITDNVASMNSLDDGIADLVFSGQNIEHLWPQDVVAFLGEAHRVLRDGGLLVVDSPNRTVTSRLGWCHPEHTFELTSEEAVRLVQLAGFTVERCAGVWDGDHLGEHRGLQATTELEMVRRVGTAETSPATSFVWWLEARRTGTPDSDALRAFVDGVFAEAWPERLRRTIVAGTLSPDGTAVSGKGLLFHGPYAPLPAGRHTATFTADVTIGADDPLGTCEVVSGDRVLATAQIEGVRPGVVRLPLEFELDEMTFAIETRVATTGAGEVAVRRDIEWSPLSWQ